MSSIGALDTPDNPVDTSLDDELNEIAGHLNAQHARLVHVAHQLATNPHTWQGPGLFTVTQYLCWRTGISTSHARQITRIAQRVDEFPECIHAFDRGELSIDQITAIVAKTPGWADHAVAELAPMLTVRQLQRLLNKYQFTNHPQPADTPADTVDIDSDTEAVDIDTVPVEGPPVPDGHHADTTDAGVVADNTCRFWMGDDGRFHLHVDCDQLSGMIIDGALSEARDLLFQHGHTDATWTDALIEIAQRSLDTIDSPQRRNRWRINVHLDTNNHATNQTGVHLPDTIRRYITCDGLFSPVTVTNGIPVSVGRTQHIVPDRTRRLVIHRDGGCAVPGCSCDRFIEIHHIIHWEHDGPSDTWNLISLCPHHHRMHHHGTLGITGNADIPGGVTFTHTDGRIITATGTKPKPPGGPPPPITGRYQHPLAERLDMKWVHLAPPPNYQHPDTHQPTTTAWP